MKSSRWPSLASPPQQCFIGITQLTPASGAGIAGLALAMALHRKGISFTLYEEAKEYSAVG